MSDHGEGRRHATGPLSQCALLLAGALAAAGLFAQDPEPTEPYRFYGGDVDRSAKDAAVEACEYRTLVEEQRCNETLNKTACIARVHEKCLADPDPDPDGDGDGDGENRGTGPVGLSAKSRRQVGPVRPTGKACAPQPRACQVPVD